MSVKEFDRALRIIKVVADFTGVPMNAIGGRARGKWAVVWARYCAVVLVQKFTRMKNADIGRILGRHRTAIFHAQGALAEVLETDNLKRVEFGMMEERVRMEVCNPK